MKDNKDTKETKKAKEGKEGKERKGQKEAKETKEVVKFGNVMPKGYVPRLKTAYAERIVQTMMKDLSLKSPMAVPKLTKIVINIGVSEAKENIQALDLAKEDLTQIAGQAPQIRRAKKSISNFKLREGMPIAVRVTLRGAMMYEFFDRFVALSMPRIRDFQGIDAKFFDGRGNLNIGLKEHHIFPEINVEKSPKARGMNITFVTTAGNNEKAKLLMEHLGMPFKKPEKKQPAAAAPVKIAEPVKTAEPAKQAEPEQKTV